MRGEEYRGVRYLSGARTRLVNSRAAELLYFAFNTLYRVGVEGWRGWGVEDCEREGDPVKRVEHEIILTTSGTILEDPRLVQPAAPGTRRSFPIGDRSTRGDKAVSRYRSNARNSSPKMRTSHREKWNFLEIRFIVSPVYRRSSFSTAFSQQFSYSFSGFFTCPLTCTLCNTAEHRVCCEQVRKSKLELRHRAARLAKATPVDGIVCVICEQVCIPLHR